jgi:conjugal transfer ATP-binding protein TraC
MNTAHSDSHFTGQRDYAHAPRFPFGEPADTPAEQFANWLPYSGYLALRRFL